MELTAPALRRKQYIEILSKNGGPNDIIEALLAKKETEPNAVFRHMEYEQAPDYENESRELQEILLDTFTINESIVETKDYIASLIRKIDDDINNITTVLKQESERLQDINMFCSIDSEYNMSVPVYASDFGDNSNYEALTNKTIGCKAVSSDSISYTIKSISGNGYSGNSFVYENDAFQNETDDRSSPEFIFDDNDVTKYEYSRLCTTSRRQAIDSVINYDEKDVEVTVTLEAEVDVCKMKLLSENTDLVVCSLETSPDGIVFTERLKAPLEINNTEAVYNDTAYIYGSGYLCFPYCRFIRIKLKSSEYTNDKIAIADEDNNIVFCENTGRKKIAINNIQLFTSNYILTDITSEEILEAGSVDKVGLFAAEYVPDHFKGERYVRYYFVINGEEHEVVPVNSGREGIKLIKFKEEEDPSVESYAELISETIKTLQLRITIEPEGKSETVYISDLKLMLGKDTGSIYVE